MAAIVHERERPVEKTRSFRIRALLEAKDAKAEQPAGVSRILPHGAFEAPFRLHSSGAITGGCLRGARQHQPQASSRLRGGRRGVSRSPQPADRRGRIPCGQERFGFLARWARTGGVGKRLLRSGRHGSAQHAQGQSERLRNSRATGGQRWR